MDGARSIDRIAEVIREAAPDVLCLQEVHRRLPQSGFEDQPTRLRKLLGLHLAFRPSFRVGAGSYGNAVLTRPPVRSLELSRLPNDAERRARPAMFLERRALLEVAVEMPEGLLRVITTHWSLAAEDRLASAVSVANRVSTGEGPCIVCGDLNAEPTSEEVRLLIEQSGLVDSGAGSAATFPADAPHQRIDYVLLPPAQATSHTVLSSQGSDHLPVFVEW